VPAITRRQLLAATGGAAALGAAAYAARTVVAPAAGGPPATAPRPHPLATPATAGAAPEGTLVLVTLYGGNDGLNTVVPYADPAYAPARPGLAVTDPLHLDSALALHPSLTGMKQLWDAGHLAIVLGVGYPQPVRSHFRSMDIWQSAVPDADVGTGWLGRWLDAQPHDPMRALSLGPTLPLLLQGARSAAGAVPTGRLAVPGGARAAALLAAMGAASPGRTPLATEVAQSGADLLTVLHDVEATLAAQPAPDTAGNANLEPAPSTAPGGQLAAQLDVVARLIRGGAPTRVYSVALGGFDTHADEKANHDRLMAQLDASVSAFVASVAHVPGVVLAAYSEFGRRVASNASGGTDHGTAAPVFVAGTGVKGGFYGEQPSLTDLDQGDLKFSTDFRAVYATLADRVLGADPASVLNGRSFAPLPFL
jgi:uncharacterized protein (DUF1501 family)